MDFVGLSPTKWNSVAGIENTKHQLVREFEVTVVFNTSDYLSSEFNMLQWVETMDKMIL